MDDMRYTVQGSIKGAMGGEVWDHDRRQTVTCCDAKFLDGGVGGDYLGLLIRSHRVTHVMASGKGGEENAETY